MNGRLRGIYAIVNEGAPDPVTIAAAALAGGVRIVQYRAKSGLVETHVRALRELTRQYDALFILNDAWEAAIAFDADGAHLGPDDVASDELSNVRARLKGRLLGLSCGTEAEARAAEAAGADYVGTGSVYATGSKDDAGPPIGLAGLQRVERATHLPVAAIGGISHATIGDVARSGVAMAAVISAISHAANPYEAARALVREWPPS